MKTERRKYDREFKRMAVELLESGKTSKEIANDLGIRSELVNRWRREFKSNEFGSFPGNGKQILTEEQKELVRLKRELADIKMERDILKKAVSIFSANDRKSTNL